MIDQNQLRANSENIKTSYFGGANFGFDVTMNKKKRSKLELIVGMNYLNEKVKMRAENYTFLNVQDEEVVEPNFDWSIKKQSFSGRILLVYNFASLGIRVKPLFGFKRSKVLSYSGFTFSRNWYHSEVSTADVNFNKRNFAQSKFSGQIVLLGLTGIFGSSDNVGLNLEFAVASPYLVRGGVIFGF